MYMFESYLKKIKSDPALYLGRKNLIALSFMISGYEEAIYDLTDKRILFNSKIQRFIEQKFITEYKQPVHWSSFLLKNRSDEEAFDMFFEVFEEFKKRYPDWSELNWSEISYAQ